MTQMTYGAGGVELTFPGWEAAMVGRRSIRIPAHAIVSACAEEGWTSEILGIRSGLVVTGYRKLGTFTHPSGVRRLVTMKRGMPLLRLRTVRRETGFDEVLISTGDAELVARAIGGISYEQR